MSNLINLLVSGSTMRIVGSIPDGANLKIEVPTAINSLVMSGSTIEGDLFVSGTLTALEMKTTVVSSSIIYRSGSTKFGDSADDIHQMTGSLRVIGSISGSFSGSVLADSLSGSLQRLTTGEAYLAAGTGIAITTQSNGQVVVSNTFAVTASWADVSASYVTLGTTGSLPNERALSASFGLLMTDGGPGGNVSLRANDNELATLSGSTFRGPVVATGGLSGSLQRLTTGETYLAAGTGIAITTQSNGQVVVANTFAVTASWADVSASYVTLGATGSLPNERVLSASFGLLMTDGGAGGNVSLRANDNELATLSGSTFRGPIVANGGLSGSLQRLNTGETYLAAGTGIAIVTQSNGQVVVSNTFAVTASWADVSASYVTLGTTGSLPNERVLSASFGLLMTDNGAGSTVSLRANDNELATLSGSNFRGPVSASGGLSGSLQQVAPGLSYLVAGAGISIASQSNGQVLVTNTLSATGSWADVSASYVTLGTTGSLPNERALSASFGLLMTDGGPGGNVSLQANDNELATLSGSLFRGRVYASGGLTGSLQEVSPGVTFLAAGQDISITTQSNGQVVIASTFKVTASWADVSASYVTLGSTGSLPNERVLSASFGLLLQDNGAGSSVSFRVNNNEVATLSGSNFRGPVSASGGISGSLQEVVSGVPYLQAGVGIQTLTQSNGSVLITASTGSVQGTSYTVPNNVKYVIFSGTLGHVTATLSADPLLWQEHVFKDADGKSPTNNIVVSASAGMRIDGGFGHEISSSYGSARLVFVGNGLWNIV